MSKIGKKKILIPKEVNVSINGDNIDIKGPYSSKKINLDTKLFEINISENKELSIKPKKKNDYFKKMWGTNRSLLNNAIIGANKGYEKTLEMTGVGYRAAIKGNSLNLQLGYNLDIDFKIPEDVKIIAGMAKSFKSPSGSPPIAVILPVVCANIKPVRESLGLNPVAGYTTHVTIGYIMPEKDSEGGFTSVGAGETGFTARDIATKGSLALQDLTTSV